MNLPRTEAAAPAVVSNAIPGLHIVANFTVERTAELTDFQFFKRFIEAQIEDFGLTKVGEVYHSFPGGGFTGVICLTESHLSIHTWPEHRYLTFDVFLSNHLKDNRSITHNLYRAVRHFFKADVQFEQIIER